MSDVVGYRNRLDKFGGKKQLVRHFQRRSSGNVLGALF